VLPLEYSSGPIRNELQPCDDEPPVGARSRQTSGPSCLDLRDRGPGDYQPAPEDLERHPEATRSFVGRTTFPTPTLSSDRCGPSSHRHPGGITCEYFGWEESRIPSPMVEDFNRYLDGVGVMSNFVRDVLRESGVNIPICVVGNGVDPTISTHPSKPRAGRLRAFSFLHVSSAFPRKGVDILLDAYFSTFDGSSYVSLILKTFPIPQEVVNCCNRWLTAPEPSDVRWINGTSTSMNSKVVQSGRLLCASGTRRGF